MPREITSTLSNATSEAVLLPDDLTAWLTEHARMHNLRWLLAHTDSGVIWGELREHSLALSSEAYPRPGLILHPRTLQQARLFSEAGEMSLWRGPNDQCYRTLRLDGHGEALASFDESYMLWGYREERPSRNGFVELREGSEGIVHALPLKHLPTQTKRASLTMRHYGDHDSTGVWHTVASRLYRLNEAEV